MMVLWEYRSPAFVGGVNAPFGRAPRPAQEDDSSAVAVPDTQVWFASGCQNN